MDGIDLGSPSTDRVRGETRIWGPGGNGDFLIAYSAGAPYLGSEYP